MTRNCCCNTYPKLIFAGFTLLGLIIYFSGCNQELFLNINHYHYLINDHILNAINLLCYSRFFILPLLLLLITVIYRKEQLLNVIILIIAYFIVFYALKLLVAEARPYVVLTPGSFFWLNHFENAKQSAYLSFPSGHTGNMAIFAFALSSMFFKQSKLGQFLMLILVISAALARILSGWHWPLDVISSGLIAYLLVKICFSFNLTKHD